MTISERINKDITDAMRARDEHRLTTLRMMKSGIRSREIDKRSPVDDQETTQILSTMIKQRKDSIKISGDLKRVANQMPVRASSP